MVDGGEDARKAKSRWIKDCRTDGLIRAVNSEQIHPKHVRIDGPGMFNNSVLNSPVSIADLVSGVLKDGSAEA